MDANPGFRADVRDATYALQYCYANVAYSPSVCESNFMSSVDSAYGQDFPYAGGSTQTLYTSAVVTLLGEIFQAQAGRDSVAVVNWLLGSARYGGISVNIGGVLSIMTNLNSFNRMWVNARKQKVCKLWMDAWNQNGCN